MRLDWQVGSLVLAEPLRISRSVMAGRDNVVVRCSADGVDGFGEVVTSRFFDLDGAGIHDALSGLRIPAGQPAEVLAELPSWSIGVPPGVRAALDAALHDLVGKSAGVPVHQVLGEAFWQPVATARTIGIGSPSESALAAKTLVESGFRVLKVKLGAAEDGTRLRAIAAAAGETRLLLDPNGAWTPDETVRFLESVADLRVDAVEQPIPPGDPDGLRWISRRSPVPVIADEDANTLADVERLAGAVDGVNIKLAKCGGVLAALEIITAARAAGMEVMLGCLVASSLGIAPAVHLTGFARWVDLDGHLLLAADPWTGIGGADGTLRLSGAPGLSVRQAEPC